MNPEPMPDNEPSRVSKSDDPVSPPANTSPQPQATQSYVFDPTIPDSVALLSIIGGINLVASIIGAGLFLLESATTRYQNGAPYFFLGIGLIVQGVVVFGLLKAVIFIVEALREIVLLLRQGNHSGS